MVDSTVCHIPPKQPDAPKNITTLPSIPLAAPNLASLTATVNALRQALIFITGQQRPNGQQQDQFKVNPGPKSNSRWSENARVVTVERVFQNNDKTSNNWVDVERINKLTMKDSVTGEQWVWDRDRK